MRPTKLEIEGFTSFRKKVEVDFAGLTLFAITGPTGAGKTSLIDAIIFALYGRTPRIGSAFSDLISQGSDRLSVLLEFSSTGRRFRVARFLKRGKKSVSSDVRFEEWQDEKWVPQSDKARQAGPMIQKLVGLDFDGFTKSVVLPQGQFDEFLRGDVAERRRILSDLLQLDVYTRMMKRANELAQQHRDEVEHLERQLAVDFADATPERLALLERERENFDSQCHGLEQEMEVIRALIPAALRLGQARAEMIKGGAELAELGPRLVEAESGIERAGESVEKSAGIIRTLEADILSSSYDPDVYARLTVTAQRAQQLEELNKRIDLLAASELEMKSKLDIARTLLSEARTEQKDAAGKRDDAQQKLEAYKIELANALTKHGSPDAIAALIDANDRRLKDQAKTASIEEELARQIASQKNKLRDIAQTGKQLETAESALAGEQEALDTLRKQHTAAELRQSLAAGAECPVCLQTVSKTPKVEAHPSLDAAKLAVESRQSLIDGLRTRKLTTEGGLGPLQQMIEGMEEQIAELRTAMAGESAKIASALGSEVGPDSGTSLSNLKRMVMSLQAECEESARLSESLTKQEQLAREKTSNVDREAGALKATLDQASLNIGSLRGESGKLRDELGKYAELPVARAELDEQIREKQKKDELELSLDREKRILAESKDTKAELLRAIEGLRIKVTRLKEDGERLVREIEELSASLKLALPDLDAGSVADADPATWLDKRQRLVQSEYNAARTSVTERQEQIKVVEQKMKRAAEIKSEVEIHTQENAIARELGLLLRSDHFVAYIQQEAYQRLATDGSSHLKTLSSDRYSFGFDKDEFVVLDHWNADEARPVTTLSGGESFLASLALALALAEGLSGLSHSRGRAALESLFLDEGFGMLDTETLDVVLGGLETLTASDRMVGIVSHIPELAERMPSRIQVGKEPGGSSLRIKN
ncbi:MAG TPA: SMC family ATPase [Blastocatellia bacterium]|nr:SMC family ATPase [Blastocatellia bacterium]